MGLPVRQQRDLELIESALRGSDPHLAAKYAMFARLTSGEEMPRIEQVRNSAVYLLGKFRSVAAAVRRKIRVRRARRQRAVLFFPLAVAIAVVSLVFVRPGSSPSCVTVKSVAAAKNPNMAETCGTGGTRGQTRPGH